MFMASVKYMLDIKGYRTTIDGDRVFLRVLEETDATLRYAGWLNDPVVNEYLETRHATIPGLREYIREKLESPTALFFGIFWKETGEQIGNVKLEPIDWSLGRATMGILIGEKAFWGRGVGTEVTNMIVQFAFETLGMAEVNLGVISENKSAIHVYEKCGFETYRVEKNAVNHEGVRYDQVLMRKRTKPRQ